MISVDHERRSRITEADPELVEPFKKVVKAAMEKVGEGEIDTLGRQRITLMHDGTSRLYHISDIHGGLIKPGDLDGGLFINCIQLDELENPLYQFVGIQIPRDVGHTTQGNLFLQRGNKPGEVERLAAELSTAKIVDEEEYNTAVRKLLSARI